MEEKALNRFVRYASLSVLSMMGLSFYVFADTFFISNKVGALGLAALNFAIPAYSAMNGTGLMLGVGGATKFAIHKAREEHDEGSRTFTNVVRLGVLLSLLFSLVGWFAADPLAVALGADAETRGMTGMYITVLLTFAPCFILNNIMIAFARNDDAPRLAMAGMLIGSVVNVVLDYVFIYPMDMGMFGAALATGIAPTVSLILVVCLHNLRKKSSFHLRHCPIRPAVMGRCCALGISAFIGEASSCIVIFVFNVTTFSLAGNLGVAAYGIIVNVAYVVISIFNGITQGGQPLLSAYYARDMRREEGQVLRYSLISALAFGGAIWVGILFFAPQVAAIFNSEQSAMLAALTIPGLKIYFTGFWLTGINLVLAAYFAAVERTRMSFAVSICRSLIGVVSLVVLLSRVFGMTGVWAAFPATEVVTFALALGLFLRFRAKRAAAFS